MLPARKRFEKRSAGAGGCGLGTDATTPKTIRSKYPATPSVSLVVLRTEAPRHIVPSA